MIAEICRNRENGRPRVKAYQGDARTLLAFNLVEAKATNLGGFTIQVGPDGKKPYFLFNTLRFEKPKAHAQVVTEPPNSSVNSPIHKGKSYTFEEEYEWLGFTARATILGLAKG